MIVSRSQFSFPGACILLPWLVDRWEKLRIVTVLIIILQFDSWKKSIKVEFKTFHQAAISPCSTTGPPASPSRWAMRNNQHRSWMGQEHFHFLARFQCSIHLISALLNVVSHPQESDVAGTLSLLRACASFYRFPSTWIFPYSNYIFWNRMVVTIKVVKE